MLVEIPERGIAEFPDDMAPDEIVEVIQRTYPDLSPKQDDLSGVKLDPYQQADLESMQAGRGKAETGMEAGTELTTALAQGAIRGAQAATSFLTETVPQTIEQVGTDVLNTPEMARFQVAKALGIDAEYKPAFKSGVPIVGAPDKTPVTSPNQSEFLQGAVDELASQITHLTTPGNVGTALLAGGLTKASSTVGAQANRALAGYFGGLIGSELPELAQNAVTVLNDPNATPEQKGAAVAQVGGPLVLATALVKGASKSSKTSTPLESKAAEIEQIAPLTAEALKQTAKEIPVETPNVEAATEPIAPKIEPVQSTKDADIARYRELDATRQQMQAEGSFIEGDNFSPEYMTIWKEMEAIKNRHGGMPPETAHLAAPLEMPKGTEVTPSDPLTPAIEKTAKTVDDFVNAPAVAGVTPASAFVRREILQDIPVAEKDMVSNDPVVEQRWKDARIQKAPLWDRIKDAANRTKQAFTRHFIELDSKEDGQVIDILRLHEEVPNSSKYQAIQVLRGITAGLGPKKYGVFSRLVILPDIVRTIKEGKYQDKELPFGYKDQAAVEADLVKFNQLAERFPDIKAAVQRRQEFITTLRDELVKRDLLPEQVKDYNDYFHRQILEYFNAKESLGVGTGASDVRTHQKGFQKKRTGSSKDFNTNYLEAEYEVISQAIAQIRTQDTLKELKSSADIKPSLMEQAKEKRVPWETLVPKDHTIWQPKPGNHFYWANSLTERTLQKYFEKLEDIKPEDVSEVLAMGGPREQWVIPNRLAKTLDNFGPPKDNVVEKIASGGIAGWKVWTLLNPSRVLRYNLNNLSGDFDITLAYNPKILSETGKAAADLYKWNIKGQAPTAELNNAMQKGVVNAGFVAKEIPDINQNHFFAAISGKEPSLISKYWQSTKDYTQWRENVLRLAAYRWFKQRLDAGKKEYGASKPEEVDAIANIDDKAAKLARELIGDYGNVSVAGQWMRRHMIPFYSWMEINAPRYVRMFRNLPQQEGGSGTRMVAVKGAELTAKAAAFYGLVNLWNHTMFPDEENELGDDRRQLHMILGRNKDGSIRSVRIQGALSDALSWFGGEDLPSDIQDVASGRTTIGTKLGETAMAPVEKLVQASSPIYKTGIETAIGQSLYPDITNPRPIRDRTEHVARLFSMDSVYRYIAGKPTRGIWNEVTRLVSYTTDPGESAYYTTRGLIGDWLKKQGEEPPPRIVPNAKSNALYFYKQALRYGDTKAAEKYLNQYYSLGGTDAGLNRSIKLGEPLQTLKSAQRQEFLDSLTPEELEMVERAEDWYDRTMEK